MKKWWIQKTALAAGLTAAFHICSPLQAWAASPPFAYTEEEWAAIRDNKLEFEEIDKRIHEYNTTVRQNEISYKDYQGKDSIWIQILLPTRRLWLPISIMSRERKV